MGNMREALLKANLVKSDDAKAEEENATFKTAVKCIPQSLEAAARKATFMRDFTSVYRSSLKNPSVSGSMPADARWVQSSGSDSGKKHKLSGMATPFGMPGRSTKVARRK